MRDGGLRLTQIVPGEVRTEDHAEEQASHEREEREDEGKHHPRSAITKPQVMPYAIA